MLCRRESLTAKYQRQRISQGLFLPTLQISTTWLCAGCFFISKWESWPPLLGQNSWRSSWCVVNMMILTCFFLMQIPHTTIDMSARSDTKHTTTIKTALWSPKYEGSLEDTVGGAKMKIKVRSFIKSYFNLSKNYLVKSHHVAWYENILNHIFLWR
jgi:hypothetical protein